MFLVCTHYSVTVSDERGCQSSSDYYLPVVMPALVLDIDNFSIVGNCSSNGPNGSITFSPPLGAGYIYRWTSSNGFSSSSEDISSLKQGTYCVEVRTISNPECIYAKGCVEVELTHGPVIQLLDKSNVHLCRGDNPSGNNCTGKLSIEIPNGATLEWSNIPNQSQINSSTITGLCEGTYTVEACLDGCCNSKTFTIECCLKISNSGEELEEVDPFTISGVPNSKEKSITLEVYGGGPHLNYRWTGPNGFTSNFKNLLNL